MKNASRKAVTICQFADEYIVRNVADAYPFHNNITDPHEKIDFIIMSDFMPFWGIIVGYWFYYHQIPEIDIPLNICIVLGAASGFIITGINAISKKF